MSTQLSAQYRNKVRLSAGVWLAWIVAVLAATALWDDTHPFLLSGFAVGSGFLSILMVRSVMRMSCPSCGTGLYWRARSVVIGKSTELRCPGCGIAVEGRSDGR
jgi:predicted RNA-binding Zn-ribbon protein involved in translation (DUF1610 family)